MSVATETARSATTRSTSRDAVRGGSAGSLAFLCALWFSLFLGVMVLLLLIVDTAITGAPRFDTELLTNYASRIRPALTGFRAGILGSLWLMVFTALLSVPLGIAAALHFEEFADNRRWYNKVIGAPKPAEPRGGAGHRVRPPRGGGHGSRRIRQDRDRARWVDRTRPS